VIQTIQVTLKGITPLLMHRFPLEPIEAIEKKPAEEQAEYAAYRHPETRELYIPAVAIQRALIAGGAYVKRKGSGTMAKSVAACVMVNGDGEYVLLGTDKYKIDKRAVTIPATKGRIVRSRPRLDEWQVSFELEYDDSLLSEPQMRAVVDNTCSRVGLLDFRPEKKGSFGRSMVTKWEPVKGKK
jgi:hypothetical protein